MDNHIENAQDTKTLEEHPDNTPPLKGNAIVPRSGISYVRRTHASALPLPMSVPRAGWRCRPSGQDHLLTQRVRFPLCLCALKPSAGHDGHSDDNHATTRTDSTRTSEETYTKHGRFANTRIFFTIFREIYKQNQAQTK